MYVCKCFCACWKSVYNSKSNIVCSKWMWYFIYLSFLPSSLILHTFVWHYQCEAGGWLIPLLCPHAAMETALCPATVLVWFDLRWSARVYRRRRPSCCCRSRCPRCWAHVRWKNPTSALKCQPACICVHLRSYQHDYDYMDTNIPILNQLTNK